MRYIAILTITLGLAACEGRTWSPPPMQYRVMHLPTPQYQAPLIRHTDCIPVGGGMLSCTTY